MSSTTLSSLPKDILVMLPDFIHNIEDYTNLSSTCHALRECMAAASPRTILKLAVPQRRVFFRPSPHFLVMATAHELGNWARQSAQNEAQFVEHCQAAGIEGLFLLAIDHCGLTVQRIRELYEMRMSIINPVTDIIDKCVRVQWSATPNVWHGGVTDALTISADPSATFFRLAIYGELFAPDFEPFLATTFDSTIRRLCVRTRLAFVIWCICKPNSPSNDGYGPMLRRFVDDETLDIWSEQCTENNLALTWVIGSSRWRTHFARFRTDVAGCQQFGPDFDEPRRRVQAPGSEVDEQERDEALWRQRLLESVALCQGLEGLGMIRPGVQTAWVEKTRRWREQIARLEREPPEARVGPWATLEYPYLLGDLRVCDAIHVSEKTLIHYESDFMPVPALVPVPSLSEWSTGRSGLQI